MRKLFFAAVLMSSLAACSMETNYAPVMDVSTIEHVPKSGVYRVMPHETLYSIAWRYGMDYRYLANLNHIAPPYHVVAGQRLYLRGKPKPMPTRELPSQPAFSAPVMTQPQQSQSIVEHHEPNAPVRTWRWPAQGPVIGTYSALNKGINIGGYSGDPIYATAAGMVVYSGNGLRGYGNLIIIKHNSAFLTAYAHSSVVLVKEGQWVKAGQEIAEMGHTGARRVMLHFEIRYNGQPVNPLNYLAK